MNNDASRIFRSVDHGRWSGVEEIPYKTANTPLFEGVGRYPIIDSETDPLIETRYFEIDSGGYSSLEFHNHRHTVVVIRGQGSLILNNSYQAIHQHDIIHISPLTLHQFLADRSQILGFICIVPQERDRPRYPSNKEINQTITDERVKAKIRP